MSETVASFDELISQLSASHRVRSGDLARVAIEGLGGLDDLEKEVTAFWDGGAVDQDRDELTNRLWNRFDDTAGSNRSRVRLFIALIDFDQTFDERAAEHFHEILTSLGLEEAEIELIFQTTLILSRISP